MSWRKWALLPKRSSKRSAVGVRRVHNFRDTRNMPYYATKNYMASFILKKVVLGSRPLCGCLGSSASITTEHEGCCSSIICGAVCSQYAFLCEAAGRWGGDAVHGAGRKVYCCIAFIGFVSCACGYTRVHGAGVGRFNIFLFLKLSLVDCGLVRCCDNLSQCNHDSFLFLRHAGSLDVRCSLPTPNDPADDES